MIFSRELSILKTKSALNMQATDNINQEWKSLQENADASINPYFESDSLVNQALDWGLNQKHVMTFTRIRAISTLFSLLKSGIANMLEYNDSNPDFPLTKQQINAYISRYLVFAIL